LAKLKRIEALALYKPGYYSDFGGLRKKLPKKESLNPPQTYEVLPRTNCELRGYMTCCPFLGRGLGGLNGGLDKLV
jgi:hypothetical protein